MKTTEQISQDTSRRNAIWAGLFYVIATAAPIMAYFFVQFLEGGVGEEVILESLIDFAANESQVKFGMLIELIYALAVVGIISTLLPILKRQNEALALGFAGLRFMEAVSVMIHTLALLSLLTISQDFAATGTPETSYFQAVGTSFLAVREWAFLIGSGLIWSLSALILNVLLYQGKLIPRWLSAWGIVGAILSLAAYVLQFFNINPSELLHLPIGVQEMVFAGWLIIKGFNGNDKMVGGE